MRPVAAIHIDEGEQTFSDEDSDNEDLCDTDSSDSDASGLDGRDHHLCKNLVHLYIRTGSF